MKIICENCGAKYSIADEKVKGKVFKIRCKKCQESIVIRGDAQIEEAAPPEQPMSPPPMPESAAAPPDDSDDGEAETKVFDYSGYQGSGDNDEAVWHISMDGGEQQGPYTGGQIAEYVAAGNLDYETFVWREGFGDWLPIKEVEDLLRVINAGGEPAPAPEPEPAVAAGGLFDSPPMAEDTGGGGLFDAAPPAADTGGGGLFDAAPPAADTGGGGLFDTAPPADTGGDLFAAPANDAASPGDVFSSAGASDSADGLFSSGQDASPDSGGGLFDTSASSGGGGDLFAESGDDDGIFASTDSAPGGPRVSAEQAMMTGQRSENSVLFSLSNLQALASGGAAQAAGGGNSFDDFGPSAGAPTAPAAPAFGEEASGLIDIRSMAASLSSDGGDGTVDDLLSLGGGGFAPTLGAPVLAAAPQEGMSMGMKIGIIGGGVVLLAVLVVLGVFLLQPEEKDTSAQDQQIATLMAELDKLKASGGNQAAQDELLKKIAAQEAVKEDSQTEEAAKAKDTEEEDAKAKKSSGKAKASSSKPKSSGGSKASTSTGSSSSSSKDEKPKPKKKVDELDDLLGGATGGAPKKKKKEEPKPASGGGGLPEKLTKQQVMSGMNAVKGSVKRCGQGQSGSVTVKAVIAPTGRVTSATTTGSFAGTPAGLCAARAVRRAKFPKTQKQLSVTYPFKF